MRSCGGGCLRSMGRQTSLRRAETCSREGATPRRVGLSRESRRREGVYNASFQDGLESCKHPNRSLGLSNVDVLGMCLNAHPLLCSHILHVYAAASEGGHCIHIGVDSDVVCSTIIGNARASARGMDDGRFHAFFVSFRFDTVQKTGDHIA